MPTLVAGAAPIPGAERFYRALLAEADHVVAADAAGEWCVGLGRVPDVVVGDFDSASEGAAERLATAGAQVVAVSVDKDETDLELAVEVARVRFGLPVVITAAFTGRLDHTLASLGTLERAGAGACVREPGWSAWLCTREEPFAATLQPGTPLSLLAPAGASGVSVHGTKWPLNGEYLEPLSGRGVSNEALGGHVDVSVGEGLLLVIVGAA